MQKGLHYCLWLLVICLLPTERATMPTLRPGAGTPEPALLCPRPRQPGKFPLMWQTWQSQTQPTFLRQSRPISPSAPVQQDGEGKKMFLWPEILVCWLKNSLPSRSLFKGHLLSSSSPPATCTPSLAGVLHPWHCVPPPALAAPVLPLQTALLSTLPLSKPLSMGSSRSLSVGIFPVSDFFLSD